VVRVVIDNLIIVDCEEGSMGHSGPWKKRHTGVNEMNKRSDEFRHHTDSALIALHSGLGGRVTRMHTRLKIVLIVLLMSVIGAVSLFRVVSWIAYIFIGVSIVSSFVGLHAIHMKEKFSNRISMIFAELKARGAAHRL